jgi:hypothetical protein
MSIHRYPTQLLTGDYLRAGGGLLLTLVPLVIFQPTGWVVGISLFLVAAICAYFLFRTVERHRTLVAMDDEGIVMRGLKPTHLAWKDIDDVKLIYHAVPRNKSESWMQLTIAARGESMQVDSRMEDFVEIVERAAEAARDNNVTLNRITQANLKALQIEDF